MTECERIIKEGILPESFFKPETICDFYVDEKRKKIWAVELDLLLKFDSVCKKHNLTYFVTDGTLIGVIRHKGFIPWDDDIDISMPRADYEKLKTLSNEFDHPYFLQVPETDRGFYYSYMKIRNSNTSGYSTAFQYQGFNEGLFLDVFPLDNVDIKEGKVVYLEISKLTKAVSSYMKLSNPNLNKEERRTLEVLACKNPMECCRKIQKLACSFNDRYTGYVSHWVSTFDPFEKKVWYAEDFRDVVLKDFLGYKIPVPIGYDRYLRNYYGDYMQMPSIEERNKVCHYNIVFDPDVPYTIKKRQSQ